MKLKAVVTVFQCKRVVFPHLFLTHALPRMQSIFPGEIEAFLIQHVGGFSDDVRTRSETVKLDWDRLQLVQEWTEAGRYPNATIIRHSDSQPLYPHMPSFRRGLEIAVEREADFHLWLEDDALVYDTECHRWPELLANQYVGDYEAHELVHVAYTVTTLAFDRKILPLIANNRDLWKVRGQNYDRRGNFKPWKVEARLATESTGRRVQLNPRHAARVHRESRLKRWAGKERCLKIIGEICPREAELFDVDFGYLDWKWSVGGFYPRDLVLPFKRNKILGSRLISYLLGWWRWLHLGSYCAARERFRAYLERKSAENRRKDKPYRELASLEVRSSGPPAPSPGRNARK